jgi:ABC-2 type transport system ATP-binding protein
MKIIAENLVKTYGNRKVVEDLSFEIRNGQILGLLGPNGAGKSTTIKMLSGQIKPNGGKIYLDGVQMDSVPPSYRSKIGVMPQEVIIWDDLTVKENLEFTSHLFQLDKKQAKKKINALIEGLNLGKEINTIANKLSGGFKRRLNLALTLINDPSAVFLDEPTPGIDPQNRRFLWEYISSLKDQNRSVILTDHYLDEAEKLSDFVVIIDNGKVIASGTVRELQKKYGEGHFLIIHLEEDNSKQNILKAQSRLNKEFGNCQATDELLNINVKDPVTALRFSIDILKEFSINYQDLQLKEPSLEDIFLLLTGKNIRE